MDVTGLVLAVPTVIELCLKSGAHLLARIRAYTHAEHPLQESLLCIQNIWLALSVQIEILRDLWHQLPGHLQVHQNSILQVLQSKIQAIVLRLDGLIDGKVYTNSSGASQEVSGYNSIARNLSTVGRKEGAWRKAKFAVWGREPLLELIEDLEKWQTRFDRSWLMIGMVVGPGIDRSIEKAAVSQRQQLGVVKQMQNLRMVKTKAFYEKSEWQRPTFINADRITPVGSGNIAYLEVQLAVYTGADGNRQRALLDNAPKDMKRRDVKNLAWKFAEVDPSVVQLLPCIGVVEIPGPSDLIPRFQLVFKTDENLSAPRTLREALLDHGQQGTLSERINLAGSLARSIIFFHESGFVHKNIRPETIILLKDGIKKQTFGEAYLLGFEEARSEERHTFLRGDDVLKKNIYRHPQRQGVHVQEEYRFQHDIYSIGVSLLEIGLWTSLVMYDEKELCEDKSPIAKVTEVLQDKKPFELKQQLVEIAELELPSRMGEIYTEVVVSCLTCLDNDSVVFGDLRHFTDDDGIIVGVRYIEKVLQIIEQIVV